MPSTVVRIEGYSESEGAQNVFIEMFDRQLEDGSSVAVSNNGTLYISDAGRHVIWKAKAGQPSSLYAGAENTAAMANGTALNARFNAPKDIAVDSSGTVYVHDSGNNRIRKISRNGDVSTFASFSASVSEVLIDISEDEVLYASVAPNILKIQSVANSINSVFDKTITDGSGVAVGKDGTLYVSDAARHVIWMQKGGLTSTRLAGRTNDPGLTNGVANQAQFRRPNDMAVDAAGNLYVYDSGNNRIRKVDKNGYTTTIAQVSETVTKTRITVSPNGTVYIVSLSESISSSSSMSSSSVSSSSVSSSSVSSSSMSSSSESSSSTSSSCSSSGVAGSSSSSGTVGPEEIVLTISGMVGSNWNGLGNGVHNLDGVENGPNIVTFTDGVITFSHTWAYPTTGTQIDHLSFFKAAGSSYGSISGYSRALMFYNSATIFTYYNFSPTTVGSGIGQSAPCLNKSVTDSGVTFTWAKGADWSPGNM